MNAYYLRADGKWHIFSDGRWQFLASEMPEVSLQIIVGYDSDILMVCKLSAEENVAFYKAQKALHLQPELKWVMYEEASHGKEG